MTDKQERWSRISEFPNYSVSTLGRVMRSVDGTNARSGKIMKQQEFAGYKSVQLSYLGKRANRRVHRLVAIAFIENREGKPVVNHKNGNKGDNRLANLEWATVQENEFHASMMGLKAHGTRNALSKLTDQIVVAIRKSRLRNSELASLYQVDQATLRDARLGVTWRHVKVEHKGAVQ